jgi:hypothetical protein
VPIDVRAWFGTVRLKSVNRHSGVVQDDQVEKGDKIVSMQIDVGRRGCEWITEEEI